MLTVCTLEELLFALYKAHAALHRSHMSFRSRLAKALVPWILGSGTGGKWNSETWAELPGFKRHADEGNQQNFHRNLLEGTSGPHHLSRVPLQLH